ncbi:MAG: hypothetical protein Q7T03_07025 [Deltaproteobacteria bacterium]|nr:hypothetical protein [Deltaproteobacteria bacterium]
MTLDNSPIVREGQLLERAIFVGGLGGCGKTMLTAIIGGFDRVEIQKYNYVIENICTLHRLGKVGDDVAFAMIRMQTDLDIYNMMMSRETNFRFSDLSSVFKNPGKWRYFRRLFQAGDDAIVDRVKNERPILHITFHDLLQHSHPLLKALGEKARLLELVRHPLYMIKQWYKNVEQFYDNTFNPREFSIRFLYKQNSLPWFVSGWEEEYLKITNKMDRVIYMMRHHIEESKRCYEALSENEKKQVMIISFENFVKNPWADLEKLEHFLDSKVTKRTLKELKRQNIPRKMLADGINLKVYRKYGWKPSDKRLGEAGELQERRNFAEERASSEGMRVLDAMSANYEKEYFDRKI